jgi:hypothetical protein
VSDAWSALAGGAWDGPIRFEAAGGTWAGAVRRVDADEDEREVALYAQARRLRGWAGVTADITACPEGRSGYTLDADATISGAATDAAAAALLDAVRARIDAARTAGASPADDPAWRRRLAMRAALAVGVGVAAGLAGAAWDRRRRG